MRPSCTEPAELLAELGRLWSESDPRWRATAVSGVVAARVRSAGGGLAPVRASHRRLRRCAAGGVKRLMPLNAIVAGEDGDSAHANCTMRAACVDISLTEREKRAAG